MRQTSGIFGSMVRSLVGSTPEPGDSDFKWPQTLVPIFPAGFTHDPFSSPTPGSTTDTFPNVSFVTSYTRSRAAAAANEDTVIFCLTEGAWEFTCDWYLSFPVAATFAGIQIIFRKSPAGPTLQTLDILRVVNPQAVYTNNGRMRHYFFIPLGHFWRFTVSLDNTGGATIMNFAAMFNCRKLS